MSPPPVPSFLGLFVNPKRIVDGFLVSYFYAGNALCRANCDVIARAPQHVAPQHHQLTLILITDWVQRATNGGKPRAERRAPIA